MSEIVCACLNPKILYFSQTLDPKNPWKTSRKLHIIGDCKK